VQGDLQCITPYVTNAVNSARCRLNLQATNPYTAATVLNINQEEDLDEIPDEALDEALDEETPKEMITQNEECIPQHVMNVEMNVKYRLNLLATNQYSAVIVSAEQAKREVTEAGTPGDEMVGTEIAGGRIVEAEIPEVRITGSCRHKLMP